MNPTLRAAATRLGQIVLTFALFAICNVVAVDFEIENGISILFPATAIGILACMFFGEWAAIGIVLAVIATPWSPTFGWRILIISGLLRAITAHWPTRCRSWWRSSFWDGARRSPCGSTF